jgi:hypothetical protein
MSRGATDDQKSTESSSTPSEPSGPTHDEMSDAEFFRRMLKIKKPLDLPHEPQEPSPGAPKKGAP